MCTFTFVTAKSKPFSIHISVGTDELVSAEAQRTHRSKGAVIEGLAEEALRTRMFPGIAFRGWTGSGALGWSGRRWTFWQVIDAYRDVGSVEKMVAAGDLDEQQIRLALAYYERFPEEIDEAIALQRRPLAQLRAEYPFINIYTPAEK